MITEGSTIVLGRYRLLQNLGGTQIAVVYRAEDISNGRQVALKKLSAYFSRDQGRLQTFRQALDHIIQLDHPNIVKLEGLEEDSVHLWRVEEYISFPNFHRRRDSGLRLPQVIGVVRQVASALDHGHAQGVVHGNLKPSNVFLDPKTARDAVSDFGLWVLTRDAEPLFWDTLRTPFAPYTSLGQHQNAPPSVLWDVYALGALIYYWLTGRPPCYGVEHQTVAAKQLIGPPPSSVQLVEAIRTQISEVVQRALRSDWPRKLMTCGNWLIPWMKRFRHTLPLRRCHLQQRHLTQRGQ